MAATMREVALRAGVSIRTVSRAINGLDDISIETRQRVLAIAEELGYRPSMLARALVTRRSRTLGLAIPHITNPYFAELAQGCLNTSREKGYSILIDSFSSRLVQDLNSWQTLVDRAVEGIITNLFYGGEPVLLEFSRTFKPVVVLLRRMAYPGISSVTLDMESAAEMAVNYLIGQGHRRIAMLVVPVARTQPVERVAGYRKAMAGSGLKPVIQYLGQDWQEPDVPEGCQATLRLFETHPEITAIFAYNDLLAIGAIQACKKTGRRVPGDCAVIGFDDIPFASYLTPALSTVGVDKYSLGQQSVLRLLEMLEQPGRVFEPVMLDARLVLRESA